MARIMISATGSGVGKTTFTCGLLMALQKRGLQLQSFKCGPDYIDPMFHRAALGISAGNVDSFFMEDDFLRGMVREKEALADCCLLEGAMGFYDGIGDTTEASAYEISGITETPVILLVNGSGMGVHSILASLKGWISYRPNAIAGVIFNRISPSVYGDLCRVMAEQDDSWPEPLGFLPKNQEVVLESRHLGLMTPEEADNLRDKLEQMGQLVEQNCNVNRILELAATASVLQAESVWPAGKTQPKKARVAVARDRAFCFYYEENLQLLEQQGAELVWFSPLEDEKLPADCDALYLGGGYPELYGRELSQNETMRESIRQAIANGMPVIGECGGFLYLQQELEDRDGTVYPMAGVLPGKGYATGKLQRFGYITLETDRENPSGQVPTQIKAHEFHYWDSTHCGEDATAKKAGRERTWQCGHITKRSYMGFPHLAFCSNPEWVKGFVEQAAVFGKAREKSE